TTPGWNPPTPHTTRTPATTTTPYPSTDPTTTPRHRSSGSTDTCTGCSRWTRRPDSHQHKRRCVKQGTISRTVGCRGGRPGRLERAADRPDQDRAGDRVGSRDE